MTPYAERGPWWDIKLLPWTAEQPDYRRLTATDNGVAECEDYRQRCSRATQQKTQTMGTAVQG